MSDSLFGRRPTLGGVDIRNLNRDDFYNMAINGPNPSQKMLQVVEFLETASAYYVSDLDDAGQAAVADILGLPKFGGLENVLRSNEGGVPGAKRQKSPMESENDATSGATGEVDGPSTRTEITIIPAGPRDQAMHEAQFEALRTALDDLGFDACVDIGFEKRSVAVVVAINIAIWLGGHVADAVVEQIAERVRSTLRNLRKPSSGEKRYAVIYGPDGEVLREVELQDEDSDSGTG